LIFLKYSSKQIEQYNDKKISKFVIWIVHMVKQCQIFWGEW